MADRLAEVLKQQAPPALAVAWLFGSHADARAHRESDVDLGVVFRHAALPSSRARFEAALQLSTALSESAGGPRIDLVVLNDAPPGLAARVATEGRLLYVADTAVEHAFRRDSQLQAADLLPFLRRTRQIKLEALRR